MKPEQIYQELKDLAEKLEVMEEVVKEILKKRQVPGYILLSDMLVKESKLKEMDEKLKGRLRVGELNLDEASRLIEEMGGRNPVSLLEALDYKIDWRGLDAKNARIKEKRRVANNL